MATVKKAPRIKAPVKKVAPKSTVKNTNGQGALGKEESSPIVKFHYIKSTLFRTVHVDGAHGAITPHGDIQMSAYSERLPIPRETAHSINGDGTMGDELLDQRIARAGVVREVEINLVMSIAKAKAIVDWLQIKIAQAEDAKASQQKSQEKNKPKPVTTRKKAAKKKTVRKKG